MRPSLELLESRLLLAHPFLLQNEQEPNDSLDTANNIALQSDHDIFPPDQRTAIGNVQGSLAEASAVDADVDFFAVSARAGSKLNFSFSGSALADRIVPRLLNESGAVIAEFHAPRNAPNNTTGDGAPHELVAELATETATTFYLQVGPGRDANGDGETAYGLSVRATLDPHAENEPNDTFDTAQEIPLIWVTNARLAGSPLQTVASGFVRGSLENGEVSPDADFYQIAVGPNSTIGVRAVGAGAQGAHLTIYDQGQNVIVEAEPNADGVLAARFKSDAESRFFIRLTDAGNVFCITTPCLTYELHVTARQEFVDPYAEQEPNDSIETANPLHYAYPWIATPLEVAAAPGNTIAGTNRESDMICLAIGCGDPEWWWRDRHAAFLVRGNFTTPTGRSDSDFFSFPAGRDRNIVVSYRGNAAAAIELLDANGIALARTTSSPNDPDEATTNQGTTEFFTTVAGTYFIHLRGADGEPAQESDYSLHVSALFEPNVEHEPNDTLDTANRIDLPGRFDLPCVFVCPLADAAGVVDDANELGKANDESSAGAGVARRPIRWPGDDSLHGFITGELEFFTCPPEMACIAVVQHGVDDFVFDVPAKQFVSVRLTGPLARNYGVLTLLDGDGNVLIADDDNSDGLAVEWRAREGGTLYARVTAGFPTFELQVDNVASAFRCDDSPVLAGSLCASPWTYRVDVTSEPLPNPIEGKDEHEPNDTIDQANHLELRRDGSVKWGVVFRERVAHGIAGGPTHDVDFFSFEARPGEDVTVGLGCVPGFDLGPIVILPGDPDDPPIELPEPITTPVLVVVVFDSDGNEIGRTGIDGSENVLFHSDSGGVYYAMMMLEGGAPDAEPTPYELHIHTRLLDLEGRDEHEPNDTIDQTNELPLNVFPTFAPGIVLRGGDAAGIAGGPTADVDAFEFVIEAGEHFTVDVQGLVFDGLLPRPIQIWLDENGLDEFGDPAGTRRAGPRRHDTEPPDPADLIHHILQKHPHLEFGQFVVTVFDSAGNEVGSSASSDSGAVTFDSAAGGAYFAIVSAAESSATDRPGHYRLGVIARSDFDPEKVDPSDPNAGTGEGGEEVDEVPFVVVLGPRGSFAYTDDNGDSVVIRFRGPSGKATITFTDAEADGSDIASIDIDGVRKNGSMTIHTAGSAEVGEIAIHDMASATAGARRRGGGRSASFGTIDVDGNVGRVSSDMNIRTLVVDGMLGDLDAHNRQIGEVRAETFDAALADVGSIRLLAVEGTTEDELFASLLPWEDHA